MKKMTKRMVTVLMAMLLIAAFALPVAAAERIEMKLKVGDTWNLGWSTTPYESSDTDVIRVDFDGDKEYTAVAVGVGTAVVFGGEWVNPKSEYEITVTDDDGMSVLDDELSDFHKEHNETKDRIERSNKILRVVVIVLAVLLSALLIAAIVYIFIAAPKCGMSRWWALLPLFSHVLGLLVFIVMRSNRKSQSAFVNTFACPVCSAVHPYGTAVCSVCGKKFS